MKLDLALHQFLFFLRLEGCIEHILRSKERRQKTGWTTANYNDIVLSDHVIQFGIV